MDSGGGPKGARVPGSNFLIFIYIYIVIIYFILGCVWLNIKYFSSVKYLRERKIFLSI